MKLTETQIALLRWLDHIGGVCVPYRDRVAHPWWSIPAAQRRGQQEPAQARYKMPAISALHLVVAGCIDVVDGQLRITGRGRRELQP